jgi:hypothetical protein
MERMQAEEELVRVVDIKSGDGFDAPTLGDEFHADATSQRRSPGGWWARRSRRIRRSWRYCAVTTASMPLPWPRKKVGGGGGSSPEMAGPCALAPASPPALARMVR